LEVSMTEAGDVAGFTVVSSATCFSGASNEDFIRVASAYRSRDSPTSALNMTSPRRPDAGLVRR